jgi:hypothetical protein
MQNDMFDIYSKPIYELSIAEAAQLPKFDRIFETPEKSFDQFCHGKGEGGIHHKALNGLCARLFIDCTRGSISDHKKVSQGNKAILRLEELRFEYARAITGGEIKVNISTRKLDLRKESDYARARILLRLAVRRAVKQGLNVPEENLKLLEKH